MKFIKIKMKDLFDCDTGDVDVQRKHLNGKGTWYINSGVTNMGIIGKTDHTAKIFPANTITVDMFGNAYYRPFEYKMATHAHVFSLSLKNGMLGEKEGLYLVSTMGYFTRLFSFNKMCNWNRMKGLELLLPTSDGITPDFEYMCERIAELERERIAELERERIAELEAYLEVTGLKDYELTLRERERH